MEFAIKCSSLVGIIARKFYGSFHLIIVSIKIDELISIAVSDQPANKFLLYNSYNYFAAMYSRQEASQLRKNFWTSFGQYMRPLPNAEGGTVNWLNYKTDVRHLYFRMDADNKRASIAIEMRHPDVSLQQEYFQKFVALKNVLHETLQEEWDWQLHATDEDGKPVSRISKTINGVNIFNNADWPAIISFLKPRIRALDNFWNLVKEGFL